MLPLLASIGGILLGLHFTVIVLLPVSLLATAVFISYNSASGGLGHASFSQLIFVLIFTQAGYILGLLGRDSCARLMTRLQSPLSKRI